MKVLIDAVQVPFMLAHGGVQIQIEQTRRALEGIGVEVEYVRWWDDRQQGDLIHCFGRCSGEYLRFAHGKGYPVVMTELLSGTGARSSMLLLVQKVVMRLSQRLLPANFTARLNWEAFRQADAICASTRWEASLMGRLFGAPAHKVHVVSNGVDESFFEKAKAARGDLLVCVGTIHEIKRTVELAEAAIAAQVPVRFIGRPYANDAPYARRFFELAAQHSQWVHYEGSVSFERLVQAYREARGFVLLSRWETLSLAALEAAAAGCPLLLSDLPWACSVFGEGVSYCPVTRSTKRTAQALRQFYEQAPSLKPPSPPKTWPEIGLQIKGIYEAVRGAAAGRPHGSG